MNLNIWQMGFAAVNYFPSRSYDTNETPESCAEREWLEETEY